MKKFIPVILLILASCVPWNLAPHCKIEVPENGSQFLKGDTILVYVNANDDDGDIAEVRLYLDGVGIFSVDVFPYVYDLETAGLELGSHHLKAVAYDNNRKEAESERNFTILSGLPRVRTLPPVIVYDNDLIVGGTITDNGGGTIARAGIMWSNNPFDVIGNNDTILEVHNNTFSVTLPSLAYETYYVVAYADNESGRSYGEIADATIPAPPVCEILEPADGASIVQGDSLTVLVNAEDDDGLIRQVRIYVDTKPVAASTDFPYAFKVPTAGLAIGMHTVDAVAEDDSGIQAEDAINFTVNSAK